MNANKIIKALECHRDETNSCKECAYNYERGCSLRLAADTLDLIEELQAEIERLAEQGYIHYSEEDENWYPSEIKMQYCYFVSYLHSNGKKLNTANAKIVSEKEIDSYEDVVEMAELIAKTENLDHNPTILFYKLIKKESADNGNTEKDS